MEIRSLNTLRGLAALIVLLAHFSNVTGYHKEVLGNRAGQIGVMLFFLLSGFLMTHLYWDQKPSFPNLMSYTRSRAARIVPLYVVVVLLSFSTPFLYPIDSVQSLISHLLFLHGHSVLWTIPTEVQFYALFGLAWSLFSARQTALPFVLVSVCASTFLLGDNGRTIQLFGLPFTASIVKALPYFVLGCVLGGAYQSRQAMTWPKSHYYVLALLLIPMIYPHVFGALFGFQHAMWKDARILAIMGLVFFAVTFLVPAGNPWIENRIGDFFGKISYSLYLLHLPVLIVLKWIGWADFGVLSLALFVALASLVAWLSFHIIEAPCRQAIRALGTQDRHAPGVQPAECSV